jgi:uncharacterized membrane protein
LPGAINSAKQRSQNLDRLSPKTGGPANERIGAGFLSCVSRIEVLKALISRKSVIQIFAVAALLIGARLATDLTSAAAYVYPDFDFGQFWIAFLFFLLSLLFAAILALVRLFQKRFVEALVLVVVLCVPFSFKDAFDRHYWKFQIHKSEYQSAITADAQPAPKYRVFDWGNRNTSLGGGVIFEAIVYDETDEIMRPAEVRSPDWVKRRANSPLADSWITARPTPYPACKRLTKSFSGHFYYLSEEC